MGILNYLPTFKVVEINRSTGLVIGHVLSQYTGGVDLTSNTTAVSGKEFLENGIIVGLSNDLTVENFDPEKHSQPFVVFVEELNTFIDSLNRFATEFDSNDVVYPRAIGLYNGDTFTTDNYLGTYGTQKYAKVVDGVLTLQAAADAYTLFAVESSSLPDGSDALRFTYIGNALMGEGLIDELTFDMNGGTWEESTDDEVIQIYDGTTFAAAQITPNPTYADHQFDGWYYDAATSTNPVELTDTITADTTVYAKWLELFDITFALNGGNIGGSTVSVVESDIAEGSYILDYTPADPVYADHDFNGWFYDMEGSTNPVLPTDEIVADDTIYAGWLELFNITFDGNGGTIDGDATAVILDVAEGNYILDYVPADPVWEDHNFNGWYYDAAASTDPVGAEDPITADDTIYAGWLELFDVTFNGNGGTIDGNATAVILDVEEGELIGSIDFGSTPVYTGYTWVTPYWSSTSAIPYVDAASTTVSADTTVYAAWEATEYTITYTLTEGATHSNPITYTIGTTTITLTPAALADHTFGGWFTDEAYTPGNEVTEITLGTTGNITLYGKLTHI